MGQPAAAAGAASADGAGAAPSSEREEQRRGDGCAPESTARAAARPDIAATYAAARLPVNGSASAEPGEQQDRERDDRSERDDDAVGDEQGRHETRVVAPAGNVGLSLARRPSRPRP